MKKKLLLLLCVMQLGAVAMAQENDEVRYNQYGVQVDRKELKTEARNNILVFESKKQDYKVWFDNRVQVDGATFWGKNPDYNPIGKSVKLCGFS